MRIKNPAAAKTLLDIAESSSRLRQRVLFFCACKRPGTETNGCCHRVVVARLVLKAAKSRKVAVQIVEWPGGEPEKDGVEVPLSKAAFAKVARGAASIPLQKPVPLAEMAGLPWLSSVTVYEKGNEEQTPLIVLGGPARYMKGGWHVPIHEDIPENLPHHKIPKYIEKLRKRQGFAYRYAQRR